MPGVASKVDIVARVILVLHHAIKPFAILMKFIFVHFILQPEHDHKTACHSKSQPENIDQGKCRVLQKVSPCRLEIIFDHIVKSKGKKSKFKTTIFTF
jgi:hypothetical protein